MLLKKCRNDNICPTGYELINSTKKSIYDCNNDNYYEYIISVYNKLTNIINILLFNSFIFQ